MELSEWAAKILFATTLEEKLERPAVITDERPAAALFAPETPGRPKELRFKPRSSRGSDFPQTRHLEDERDRGRLLHFFANHELLATELMALVLVRFPEAPTAFRRGVLETLKDEQIHTKLYIQRMKECGIEFGELPVSGYFWRAVSTMESPIDYVAALSLTFEQANLDFCRDFAQRFAAAGDAPTAQLLGRIYRDEIAHVAHGLKWFRRWKNPSESDWNAFCRQLKFPLSPQRAKGLSLNVPGRRMAGLDQAFIDELNIYSHSKGRTPTLFLFNPFTEERIAHGHSFAPTKQQSMLVEDLANLPQFLCRQDDVVLLPARPSVEFLTTIKQAGFSLPEFIPDVSSIRDRKLNDLRPWAWGPDSVELLAPLFKNLAGDKPALSQRFNQEVSELYSKSWAALFLGEFMQNHAESWLCGREEIGLPANTVDGVLSAVTRIRGRGHHRIVIKQEFGAAGRNAIRLWEPGLLDNQRRWIANAIDAGMTLLIEPWLDRILDFSIQMEMGSRGLKLCGYTGLINDRRGQFHGNWAEPDHVRRIPAGVLALFEGPRDIAGSLHRLYAELFERLELELVRVGFNGPIGIDAFVYRAPDGSRKLKPIVEINPRYTMGRLTVELMKQTCPGSHGLFRLVSKANLRSLGVADFSSYARALREQSPMRLEGAPVARIRAGALCLNDPGRVQTCLAVFQVNRGLLGSPGSEKAGQARDAADP